MIRYSRAVLVVSFGTSDQVSEESTVAAAEREIGERFEGVRVYRAYSSDSVRKKLRRERGIRVDDVQEALERIKTDGYMQVYVQPTHLIDDAANEDMTEEVDARIACGCYAAAVTGRPLLDSEADFEKAAAALAASLPDARREDTGVILTGCTGSYSEKAALSGLQKNFDKLDMKNFFTAPAGAEEEIQKLADKLKENGICEVMLIPLSFSSDSSGYHIDDEKYRGRNKTKDVLLSGGFRVRSALKGLGECSGIRELAGDHLAEILR